MVHRRSPWLNRNRLNELLTRELRTVLGCGGSIDSRRSESRRSARRKHLVELRLQHPQNGHRLLVLAVPFRWASLLCDVPRQRRQPTLSSA